MLQQKHLISSEMLWRALCPLSQHKFYKALSQYQVFICIINIKAKNFVNSNLFYDYLNYYDLDDVSELPPEFRSAGLTAQMEIQSGKVFGPFSGLISEADNPPKSSYILVCQVRVLNFPKL